MQKILTEMFENGNVLFDEPMSSHTTFHIGGKADCFIKVRSIDDIKKAVSFCKENNLPIFILGNGSNILVGDKGIRGVVLQIEKSFDKIYIEDDTVCAEAGVLLSKLSSFCLKNGLSGMECLSGIPGTLGGAVYMNAGAYGDEISNHIIDVTFFDSDLNLVTLKKEECDFGYRKSIFTDTDNIIVSVRLKFISSDIESIHNKTQEYKEKRVSKQPVDKFSAGSTFKRPEGNFAGTLIEGAGLKGKKIGGAEVSEKHAGFIINNGDATATDVLELVGFVQKTVYENSGILLEPEIKKIGEF